MNVKKKMCILLVVAISGEGLKAPESPFGGGGLEDNRPFPFGAPSTSESHFGAPKEVSPFQTKPPVSESNFENPKEEESPFQTHSSASENHFGASKEASPFQTQPPVPEESTSSEEPSRSVMSGSYDDSAYQSMNPPAIQESTQEAAQQNLVDSTVDTFETEDSGNWLLKRVWWEKTEDVYEQIKQVFNDIMNARMEFVTQRNSLDRELDVFYGQMGLEEGPLQNIINKALAFLKRDKTEQGFLNKKEEEFLTLVKGKDRDFEQLKLDVEALKDLDQKVDEALDTLFAQIDIANKYEQKAWENFKEIARELNDKVARKTYYETEALLKDSKNIQSYINDQFSHY